MNATEDWSGNLTPVRCNEVYTVTDLPSLGNMIVSQTILRSYQKTSGHNHEGYCEVYFFFSGSGTMLLTNEEGTIEHTVGKNSVILIEDGIHHQVINDFDEDLIFIAVFENYGR